jgi:ADP-ribosylglycohydrolase
MVGGGPFNLVPGLWTDDTSLELCLAESLIECQGMDLSDQITRYVRWFSHGYLSSTGVCFDIGNTVRNALVNFERTGNPQSGSRIFTPQDTDQSRAWNQNPREVSICSQYGAVKLGYSAYI